MNYAARGRLAADSRALRWFFKPQGTVNAAGRAFMLGQLFASPTAAIMGAFCASIVAIAGLLRSGGPAYGIFVALELALLLSRLVEWRAREVRLRIDPGHVPTIDMSVSLSFLWSALQGSLAFWMMWKGDPQLRVLSATLVMALIGPVCARNYAAPRFAFLLVLLFSLPFVAGALTSGEPLFAVIALMTPPFLLGAMQIIATFHQTMLVTLAAETRSRHLALHDSLTGIPNRQGMDQALSLISADPGRSMALLCLDLDGFKQVNDRHGHGAGDLILIQAAQRIRETIGPDDLVARMGGDEFMIVVRNVTPEAVSPLVERLIDAISASYELNDGAVASVGASIGFACLPEDGVSTIELRLRADEALYAAKGAGKGVGHRYRARKQAQNIRRGS